MFRLAGFGSVRISSYPNWNGKYLQKYGPGNHIHNGAVTPQLYRAKIQSFPADIIKYFNVRPAAERRNASFQ